MCYLSIQICPVSTILTMTRTKFIFWFVTLCANIGQLSGFNIYEDNVDIFRGDSGSLFGYSVLQHENLQGKWILVGAPNSSSVHQRSLQSPGALFKCTVSETRTSPTDQRCEQVALDMTGNGKTYYDRTTRLYNMDVKDNQWLGVSLDRHQGASGHRGQVVVCGHRWMRRTNSYNSFDRYYNQYSYGTCYTIDSELQTRGIAIQPCLKGPAIWQNGILWHALCQAGSSAHYTNDGTLLLGAPGTVGWRGTVIAMRKSDPEIAPWYTWFPGGESGREAYLGYSLSSGSFTKPTANEGVTGAPRAYEFGKVFIFDVKTFKVMIELVGEQMNAYFGSSVLAVDLNADGFSDLLVGAPLYTDRMDEGRVYVYINHGQGNLRLLQDRLKGNNAVGARFGTAIANVGDLNQDGYTDIAIGAPFEVGGSGAVYIYHGSVLGIRTKYVQRLSGKSAMAGITSFGNSISGGMDMDGNGYPDIVIGAHQNATTIYYRTQPVISVAKSLRLIPDIFSRNSKKCFLGGPLLCVRIEMCLRYTGLQLTMKRGFNYTISADTLRTSQGLSSRFFFTQNTGSKDASIMTSYVVLQKDQETCMENTAYLKVDVRDLLTMVQFQSTYNLHEPVDESSRLPYSIDPGYPRTVAKEATFVRDCGNDDVCETDIQVASYLETLSKKRVLYLGDDTALNVDIVVTNDGEEAHQALLTVWYPSDVHYEGFQHATGEILPCDRDLYQDDQIHCRLGNPMTANTKVHFKLRFDVSALNNDREDLNFTLAVKTSSKENNGTLHNNYVAPSIPVKVLADIIVRGTSSPEQVIYDEEDTDKESLSTYLEDIRRVVTLIEESLIKSVPVADDKDQQQDNVTNEGSTGSGGERDIDETIIGPAVVFTFEVSNLGPGFIPQYSNVNISVPWRLKNGDWMLYLKGLKARAGVKDCNIQDVLKQQLSSIKEHYNWGNHTTDSVDIETENLLPLQHKSGVYTLDCSSVSCVTITCQIDPLHESDSAVIELHGLLWKHTFSQHEISMAELKTEAFVKVVDPSGRFTQPEDHQTDKAQVITNIHLAAERTLKAKPISPWIIIAAIAGGVLLLIILITIMAKFGFFRRMSKEEMKKLLDENDKDTKAAGSNEAEDIKESELEDVGYEIPMKN